jgi:hypothetical protein
MSNVQTKITRTILSNDNRDLKSIPAPQMLHRGFDYT